MITMIKDVDAIAVVVKLRRMKRKTEMSTVCKSLLCTTSAIFALNIIKIGTRKSCIIINI